MSFGLCSAQGKPKPLESNEDQGSPSAVFSPAAFDAANLSASGSKLGMESSVLVLAVMVF